MKPGGEGGQQSHKGNMVMLRSLKRKGALTRKSLFAPQHAKGRASGSRTRRLALEPLEPRLVLSGNLLITEFMADNQDGLVDRFDDHSDWIELYNRSLDPLSDLDDWYLTDNPANLHKWQLPDTTLGSHQYMLVFASNQPGDGLRDPEQELHANFALNDQGEYLALVRHDTENHQWIIEQEFSPTFPTQLPNVSYGLLAASQTLVTAGNTAKVKIPSASNPSGNWTAQNFDDTTWSGGATGVGYDGIPTVPVSGANFYYGQYGSNGTWNLYEVVNPSPAKTWLAARNDAVTRTQAGSTGHLVTIQGEMENRFVQTIIGGDAWIGLTDSETYGGAEYGNTSALPLPPLGTPPVAGQRGAGFVWVNGDSFVYQRWAASNPDDSGTAGEDAVVMLKTDGSWQDQKSGEGTQTGTTKSWYVVEYDLNLALPALPNLSVCQAYSHSPLNLSNISQAIVVLNSGAGATYNVPVVNFADPQNASNANFKYDLPFPDDTPVDDNNFATKVTGKIRIPTEGTYTFDVFSDDGFRLKITGAAFTAVYGTSGTTINGDTMEYAGTRSGDSLGVATLTAGDHYFELYQFDATGGSGLEFSSAAGTKTAWDRTFRLVGDVYNGGLATVGLLEPLVGTNVESTMRNQNSSAYVRVPFDVADPLDFDPAAYDAVTLRMKYADGFVAYLNGQEVARSGNVPATPVWNSAATGNRTSLQAQVFQTFDISDCLWVDPQSQASLLQAVGNVLAIHGMNASAGDASFLVLPEVVASTIRPESATVSYFTTPTPQAENMAGTAGTVADTAFSGDRGVFDNSLKSVTGITYSVSNGIVTATATSSGHGYLNGETVRIAGANEPQYNGVFTIANVTADTFDYTLSAAPAGPATGAITAQKVLQVAITTTTSGAQIRYTLDGSPPTATTGSVYSGPLLIDRTTTLRAAAFKPGWTATDVDTQTYVFVNDVITQSPYGQPPTGGAAVIYTTCDANATDTGGFTYADDRFNSTSNPAKADGYRDATGGYGGTAGLRVHLSAGPTAAASGAWSKTFSVDKKELYGVWLRYRMIQGADFGAGEYSEIILTVDGVRYGAGTNTSLIHHDGDGAGGSNFDSTWLTYGFNVSLGPGAHTIIVGAYDTATAAGGNTWLDAWLDEIIVSTFPAVGVYGNFVKTTQTIDYGMDPDIVTNPTWAAQMKAAMAALPTISLVTDALNLFDPDIGIYSNADQQGADWERPASVELINPDGTPGFQVNAGLRIRGGYSRSSTNPKHSLRLFFKEQYGDDKLRYPLFGDEGADEFDCVDLRTSQNYSWAYAGDVNNAMIREVFARDTLAAMGQPYTRTRDYHVYVNGQYWGLYETEERAEASFGETYLGGNKEDYDVVKVFYNSKTVIATDGNLDAWWELVKNAFRVTTYTANVNVDSLADAEAVIATPAQQLLATTNYYNTINFKNSGSDGRFGSGVDFPGLYNVATDNFVTEARGTIYFPYAGTWTLGVGGNDGFRLYLGPSGQPLTTFLELDGTRTAPGEVYEAITIAQPGPYDVRLVSYDFTGDAELEFFAARYNYEAAGFNTGVFRLVGDVNKQNSAGDADLTADKGFATTTYKSKSGTIVDSLADAETLISTPSQQNGVSTGYSEKINYADPGMEGHYGTNADFPGLSRYDTDDNNFVVEVTGTINIATAGNWTFGVNSNDSFSLKLSKSGMADQLLALDGIRNAAVDTLTTPTPFNLSQTGDYTLRLVYFDNTGPASLELFSAQGTYSTWNGTNFALVSAKTTNGFTVKTYKANITVNTLALADQVISDPTKRTSVTTGAATQINYLDASVGGHYSSNVAYPGMGIDDTDDNNYAVEVQGDIDIPATGNWTFGITSNDGCKLTLVNELTGTTYTNSWDPTTLPLVGQDSFFTFNITEAGIYRLRLVSFDNTGSAELELYSAQGTYTSFNASAFQLVKGATRAVSFSGAGPFYWQVQGRDPVTHQRDPNLPVLLDVDSLIDYMLVIMFTGDQDAPISRFVNTNGGPNNWYGMRNRNGEVGFQFFSHDAEHTLSRGDTQSAAFGDGSIANRTGPFPAGWGNFFLTTPQMLHQDLMADPEYRLRFADRVREHFFNGGALTPEACIARFQARADALGYGTPNGGPVLGESARWGDAKRTTPFNKNDWLAAVNNELNNYFVNYGPSHNTTRTATVLDQLRNAKMYDSVHSAEVLAPLYPGVEAPDFNQFGGTAPEGFQVTMSAPAGTIYFTLDGSDPRLIGGAIHGTQYTAPVVLTRTTVVKARVKSGSDWSAVSEARFLIGLPAAAGNLAVTELNYHPPLPTTEELFADPTLTSSSFQFIELKNIGTQWIDLNDVRFTNGIAFDFTTGSSVRWLDPGQYVVLAANTAGFEARYGTGITVAGTFALNLDNAGERVTLTARSGADIVNFTYSDSQPWPGRADGLGSTLEIIDPAGDAALSESWRASYKYLGTPGAAGVVPLVDVVVNEVLSHTDEPFADTIELYNTTGQGIDITGWWLSDDTADYQKFQIPTLPGGAPRVLPAFGYAVFYEGHWVDHALQFDQTYEFGGLGPKDFGLNGAHGDDAWLLKSNAGSLYFADHVGFEAAANFDNDPESFGRWQDDQGDWHFYPLRDRTLGSANDTGGNGPRVGPLVISEVMYNAPDPGPGIDPDNLAFVEIFNPTSQPLNLNNWRLRGDVDFDFTAAHNIGAGGVLVVLPFDPDDPANEEKLDNFRTYYQISPAVALAGGYSHKLDHGGGKVQLQRPDDPPLEEPTWYPGLLEDEVVYDDVAPWPLAADGGGSSLVRPAATLWGDDAASWIAAAPSPGDYTHVVGRRIFYNNSAFDNAALGLSDDNAIATDKQALRPGQKATLANYTSYSRGINGIIVDIDHLANPTTLQAGDFLFKVGNSNDLGTFTPAPAPTTVAVRDLGSGVSRVTLIWTDNAIQKQWLQVSVTATNTGLGTPDVFYFGNAIGETGNNPANAIVDLQDELGARTHKTGFVPALITSSYDFNRDRRVNATDELIARYNGTTSASALKLLDLSGGGGLWLISSAPKLGVAPALTTLAPIVQATAAEKTAAHDAVLATAAPQPRGIVDLSLEWAWLAEFDQMSVKKPSSKKSVAAPAAVL